MLQRRMCENEKRRLADLLLRRHLRTCGSRVYGYSRNVGPFAGDTVRPCGVTSQRQRTGVVRKRKRRKVRTKDDGERGAEERRGIQRRFSLSRAFEDEFHVNQIRNSRRASAINFIFIHVETECRLIRYGFIFFYKLIKTVSIIEIFQN